MAQHPFDDIDQSGVFRGAAGGSHAHDSDAHNLRLIRSDPVLQRLLTVYRRLDAEQRAELVRLAEEAPCRQ